MRMCPLVEQGDEDPLDEVLLADDDRLQRGDDLADECRLLPNGSGDVFDVGWHSLPRGGTA